MNILQISGITTKQCILHNKLALTNRRISAYNCVYCIIKLRKFCHLTGRYIYLKNVNREHGRYIYLKKR